MVAVAEIASGRVSSPSGSGAALGGQQRPTRSRSRLSALSLAVASCWAVMLPQAFANPTGGVVVAGQASMVTTGNNLLVTTQNAVGTNHSAINWQSFSIPQGNTTYFQQPNAASTSINRVVTNTPSQLFGTLGSNGNLVLVNQAGITVGAGAVVDTAGFTASALRMSDADALAGRLRFGDGAAAGGVSVQGSVLARSGDVVLLGANVGTGTNALVQSPNGSTILAAGQQIELTGRGLEGISMLVQAPSDAAVNLGTLQGDAVGIFAGTLKHSGVIQSLGMSAEGGKVVLKAADLANIDGSISAQAADGMGGVIHATADKIALQGTAVLDVSAAKGGGEILVGGGWHGQDARISNAQQTVVATGAQLLANATQQGNGGDVVIWADGITRFGGNVSSRGGAHGGNGGNAEVSGKQYLDFRGGADLTASSGKTGTLLLDPSSLTIDGVDNVDGYGGSVSGNMVAADYAGVNSQIAASTVSSLLLNADLSLEATGTVTVSSAIIKDVGGTPTTLTLKSTGGSVNVNAPISTNGAALDVTLNAYSNVSIGDSGGSISTGGGAVNMTSNMMGNITLGVDGTVNAGSGLVTLSGANTISQSTGANITAGGLTASATAAINLPETGNVVSGNIDLSGGTGTVLFHNSATSSTITNAVGGGGVSLHGPGALTISGTGVSSTNSIDINTFGALTLAGDISAGNTLLLTSSGQPITQTAGAIVVGGGTTINASSGNITLQQPGNTFSGPVNLMGGTIKVQSTGNLSVATLTNYTNGAIDLNAGGALSLPSAAINTGTANLSLASGSSIATPAAGLTGANVALSAAGGMITVGGPISAVGGTITLSAPTAAVMDDGGVGLLTANALNITAGGQVSLTNPANQVNSVSLDKPNGNTDQFSYMNAGALSLGPITNGSGSSYGNVDITSSAGGITQTGSMQTAYANLNSGTGNITLTESGNHFGALVVASSGAVNIVNDVTALTLYDVSSSSLKVSTLGVLNIGMYSTLSASAAGDAVVLKAAQLSTGYGGSVSLSGGGRWLAYLPSTVDCECWHTLPSDVQFLQYNYVSPGAVLGSGNGVLFTNTNAAVLTGSLTGSVSKIYDGSTSINLSGASFAGTSGSGFLDSFMPTTAPFSVSVSGTGTLSTANVGSGISVFSDGGTTVGGIAGTSSDFGPMVINVVTYGYQLNSGAYGAIGAVTPAQAIASINLSGTRVYDGTNLVNASIFTLSGLVGSETLTLSGSGTVADKNVGINKPVSLGSLALGDGSGLASNYTFSGGTAVATITPATISGITGILAQNKVYDGTTSATLSGGVLSGVISGDSVAVGPLSGAFADKNAGTAKVVNISAPVLTGTDAGNYSLTVSALTASADITAKAVDVSAISAANKIYDGNTSATLSGGVLSGVISGDTVAVGPLSGAFVDKNVGNDKVISVNSIVLTGPDAGNYRYASDSFTAKASITQRALSTWLGAASGGNWSNAANWDALPDGSNVAAVALPSSGTVVYDAAMGSTILLSLSGSGTLSVAGGSLAVTGGLSLQGYQQSGGALTTPGAFSVANNYRQTGGSVAADGAVAITQTSGDLLVGSIKGSSINLTAGGGISQAGGLVTAGLLTTQSNGSTVLNNSGNRVSAIKAYSTGTGNIELTNVGVLDVRGITTTSGSIVLNNTGGISTSGPVAARNGKITGVANSPLTIGPDGVSADGDIVLMATNLTSAGNVTLNGPVESTGGAVAVTAASNLTQNSSILAALGVSASAGGTLTVGPQATTGNQPVSYTVNNVPVSPPRPPASNTVASDQVVSLMQSTPDLSTSRDAAPIDILLKQDKERDLSKELIVSEGQVCRP